MFLLLSQRPFSFGDNPGSNALMHLFRRHVPDPGMVAERHAKEFIIMVIDGTPSHRSGQLMVPENISLVRLPPYSPELNPTEHLWDEMREKGFASRVFESLGAVIAQAAQGLKRMKDHPNILQSIIGRNRILQSFMIANWNEGGISCR
jgi:hypothetical protein